MTLQIRGVHHIVLTASDPAKSVGFYEKILGVKSDWGNETVQWFPCGSFLLYLQRPPKQGFSHDRFDENRLGLDHVGFSIEYHRELENLLRVLKELNVSSAGIEFDPDGRSD